MTRPVGVSVPRFAGPRHERVTLDRSSIRDVAMAVDDAAFMTLVRAICAGDAAAAERLLAASPGLAGERGVHDVLLDEIAHYVYGGDSALHIAAAAYQQRSCER